MHQVDVKCVAMSTPSAHVGHLVWTHSVAGNCLAMALQPGSLQPAVFLALSTILGSPCSLRVLSAPQETAHSDVFGPHAVQWELARVYNSTPLVLVMPMQMGEEG